MPTIRLICRSSCLVLACLSSPAFAEPSSNAAKPATSLAPSATCESDLSQCAAASSSLGAELLAMVPPNENGVFSPASIATAFGLLYAGARGETASQLKATMHFTSPPEQILAVLGGMNPSSPPPKKATKMRFGARAIANKGYGLRITEVVPKSVAGEAGLAQGDLLLKIDDHALVRESDYEKAVDGAGDTMQIQWFSLKRGEVQTKQVSLVAQADSAPAAAFHTANALWLQRGHKFNLLYKTSVEKAGGWIQDLNFKTDAEGSLKAINAWVSQQTQGRIPSLLEPGALNDRTRLVLTNTVYLHADWANPFEGGRSISWQSAPKPLEQVPAMSQKGNFAYAETASCQVIEVPYKDSPLVFTVFLPKKDTPWDQFRKDCSPDFMTQAFAQLKSTCVKLTLPKFRIVKSLAMEPLLQEKMPAPFSENADFSGISPHDKLKISVVRHQAFINVDEKGTEAGAATAVATGIRTVVLPEATFLADHPFIFVLRDHQSKTILFQGQLVLPDVATN